MDDKYISILNAHQISIIEYNLMAQLRTQSQSQVDLLKDVIWGNHGGNASEQIKETYATALKSSMAKGLLHVVTDTEVLAQKQAKLENIPNCDDTFLHIGDIDLTQRGYRLLREIFEVRRFEIYGEISDLEGLNIKIFSDNEMMCRSRAELLCEPDFSPFNCIKDSEDYDQAVLSGGFVPAVLAVVSRLQRIGRWRLSRFEVLNSGFCITLKYKCPAGYQRVKGH